MTLNEPNRKPLARRHVAGAAKIAMPKAPTGAHAATPGASRSAQRAAVSASGFSHEKTDSSPSAPGAENSAPASTDLGPKTRYLPALDGLRALAVLAVVLYHLNLPWIQGGLLGVTMFFVISGFIITRLLLAEIDRSGTIDFKGFWTRRVRRLVPASLAVVVVTAALCTLFNHVMLTKMRTDLLPSLLLFNNWWQVLQNTSYFDALGDPSPLKHFWSLAIEEQFYLVWPLLLLLLSSLRLGRPAQRRVVLGLAAASAVACAVLYDPAVDPSRIYYGTDTRAFSLLLGVWLALIPEDSLSPARLLRVVGLGRLVPMRRLGMRGVRSIGDGDAGGDVLEAGDAAPAPADGAVESESSANAVVKRLVAMGPWCTSDDLATDAMGVIGVVGLVLMFLLTNGYTGFQYQGGMALCSVLTLAVVAACVARDGLLVRVFSAKPLVWLGRRSYGIYLWHFPLLSLMNPASRVTAPAWWETVLQVAAVLAVAEASYRLVEEPCRHGAIGRAWAGLRQRGVAGALASPAAKVAVVGALAVCLIAVGGLAFVPNTSALSDDGAAIIADDKGDADKVPTVEKNESDAVTDAGYPEGAFDILMIGDSVSLRLVDSFTTTFPHGHIDAAKSRQFSAGIDVFRAYLDANQVGKICVFALGTNGLVTDAMVDQLMQLVGDTRVCVFVNTRSRQPWCEPTNQALASAAERYKNARVLDWYTYSGEHPDVFDGDGTHTTATGAQAYLHLVYDEVKKDLPVHPEDHIDDPVPSAAREAMSTFVQEVASKIAPPPQDGKGK